jgi:hypothetical protein
MSWRTAQDGVPDGESLTEVTVLVGETLWIAFGKHIRKHRMNADHAVGELVAHYLLHADKNDILAPRHGKPSPRAASSQKRRGAR